MVGIGAWLLNCRRSWRPCSSPKYHQQLFTIAKVEREPNVKVSSATRSPRSNDCHYLFDQITPKSLMDSRDHVLSFYSSR
jgi:hypothetical protein